MEESLYSIEFQKEVLHLLATNTTFAFNYGSLLRKDYFDAKPTKILFDLITKFVYTYESEVTLSNLLLSIDDFVEQRGFSSELFKLLKNEANQVYNTHITSEQPIIDRILTFARQQALKTAILQSIDILEKGGDYEKVLKLVDDAVAVGYGADDGSAYSDLKNLASQYRAEYSPSKLVRTGFSTFDNSLMGGMAPGEVHVIIAAPKIGKSTLACNIGTYAMISGKNVYHASLEIKKIDAMAKYAIRMTGLDYKDLMKCPIKEYKEKIQRFDKYKPQLFVNFWPEGSINAITLRSWISRKKSQTGKSPDLIIVDHDDCLLPTAGGDQEDLYNTSGNVYTDLIQLANYFKCSILTFCQPVRDAWNKADQGQLITASDMAHSAKKAHKAFSISSLNFKKGSDQGLLYLERSRRGRGEIRIPIERNLGKALIREIPKSDFVEKPVQSKKGRK